MPLTHVEWTLPCAMNFTRQTKPLHLARHPSTLLFLHYTTVPDALFKVHHSIWHTHTYLSNFIATPPFQMPFSMFITASGTPISPPLVPFEHHRSRCLFTWFITASGTPIFPLLVPFEHHRSRCTFHGSSQHLAHPYFLLLHYYSTTVPDALRHQYFHPDYSPPSSLEYFF